MAISIETLALCKKLISEAGGFTAGDLSQIESALETLTEDVADKADALEYDPTSGNLKLKAGEIDLSTVTITGNGGGNVELPPIAGDDEVDKMLDETIGEDKNN